MSRDEHTPPADLHPPPPPPVPAPVARPMETPPPPDTIVALTPDQIFERAMLDAGGCERLVQVLRNDTRNALAAFASGATSTVARVLERYMLVVGLSRAGQHRLPFSYTQRGRCQQHNPYAVLYCQADAIIRDIWDVEEHGDAEAYVRVLANVSRFRNWAKIGLPNLATRGNVKDGFLLEKL